MNDVATPSIDPRTAEARLHAGEEPAPILLDVREPSEYVGGRAVGATLAPLSASGLGSGSCRATARSSSSATRASAPGW